MTVIVACGSCGTGLRAHAKFCDECGAQTSPGSTDAAKYRQVTVLFADVVRSLDIAAAVDMERLRHIMTELVERSSAVVQRYGGTVEYNGDGVMALFGAPVALEDHAFRGCLAALAIQDEANRLAADVQSRDGLTLQVRVGLNSGQVIAGEMGSGALGYRATGEPVGLAQRMEATAAPGAVMLSETTARLVEQLTVLAEPQWVYIKGLDDPVCVRRLVAIRPRDGLTGRAEAGLVGRRWEMAAVEAIVDRAMSRRGGVVNVVGQAGIGKSRVAREAAALAAGRGIDVSWTFCESHARDIPFYAMTRLLRAGSGVVDLDDDAARARLRRQMPDADPDDLLLLDDLLGITATDIVTSQVDADARRRRLTALINTASLARTEPALFIVEDAHWIDAASESMLADLLAVIPRTPLMVLITYRPEYEGALMRAHGAQSIALAPLGDSDIAVLLDELLGSDPSVTELATLVAERAAGNPFFAEEMVRELVQRGVLTGERGAYVCRADVADVSVPATVQAAVAARIDRLSTPARRTLTAASVIGARFEADLLAALKIDAEIDELLGAELIDQVRFTPRPEYAFRHPLIRAVAYESQLKSDRAEWHRRLAAAIQEHDPGSIEENAALIAEHLTSAGDLHAAYSLHMRAGAWSASRDIGAARFGWERARLIADALPEDDPGRSAMRIAPRTMLCATDWMALQESHGRFAELRELCEAADDKVSLAVGMTSRVTELLYAGGSEGSRLASEQMQLLESIGDPNLTMGLSFVAFANWFNSGEFGKMARLSQTVVDLADGDPAKGAGFGIGSPLAVAKAFRGIARGWLGVDGWRQDLDDAFAIARSGDPSTRALVASWACGVGAAYGVLRVEDSFIGTVEEAVRDCQRFTNDYALRGAQFTLGTALLLRDGVADRSRGLELMEFSRDEWLPVRAPSLVPFATVMVAREMARNGDLDAAIADMRAAVDELRTAQRFGWSVFSTGVFVEALLARGTQTDLAEAREATAWLADRTTERASPVLEITLLRWHTLLARAQGDVVAYRHLLTRYRALAESLGFEGHIAWAEAM